MFIEGCIRFLLWNLFFFHLKKLNKNKAISININGSNYWPLSCSYNWKILKRSLFGGIWQRVLRYCMILFGLYKCYFLSLLFWFCLWVLKLFRNEEDKKYKIIKYYEDRFNVKLTWDPLFLSIKEIENILNEKAYKFIQQNAIIKIQTAVRRHILRKQYLNLIKRRNKAAIYLQKAWRR